MTPPLDTDVRALRQTLGATQAQLASLIGVHWMTVSKWERRVATPSPWQLGVLEAIAEGVRVHPAAVDLAMRHLDAGDAARALGALIAPTTLPAPPEALDPARRARQGTRVRRSVGK